MIEKIIVNKNGPYPLNGILQIPDFDLKQYPAVIFVHGSGASDMNEKVLKLTPFKDLAQGLASHGIASIRYDKRTYAYKKQYRKRPMTVKEETIEDAISACEILRNDPRIDNNNIFIIGHSMGAMLAPRIDAEGGNFKGLILMAGTPYRLEDIVIRQLTQAKNNKNFLINTILKYQVKLYSKKFENLYELSDEQAKNIKFAGNLDLYYFKEMGIKTAADYLLESDKPVLIMQGEKDFQVLKDVDFVGFKEILKEKDNIRYRLYKDLNHLFVKSIYNDILKASKEYNVEQHINDEVIEDIAAFIKS